MRRTKPRHDIGWENHGRMGGWSAVHVSAHLPNGMRSSEDTRSVLTRKC